MIVEFYNEYHLGDSVFHLTFLRKLCRLTNDTFIYYINPNYIFELRHHIVGFEDRIQLRDLAHRPQSAINAWIGEIYYRHPNNFLFDNFYVDWFNYLTKKIYNVHFNIDMYSDYLPLSNKVLGYEYLVINSVPYSGQFDYNDSLDRAIVSLAAKHQIITTKKVAGVPCTLDAMMSLVDIGATASNSENIIAINTGPISTCLNIWAVQNVKSWIVAANNHSYSLPNMQQVKNMNALIEVMNV